MKQLKKQIVRWTMAIAMIFSMIPWMTIPAQAEESNEKVVVYTQIPEDWENPCIWAWDADGNNAFDAWPGEEMEADAANEGWYYCHIPASTNHIIINANKGDVQTDEIVLESGNAWVTISAPDQVEVQTEQQTEGDLPEYVAKFAVHAKVDESWETPHLWAWSAPDGTNAFDAWPGKEMTEGENGWYTAKAPEFVNSIIINGQNGEVQTEDISIDAAEIWVTVDKDGKYDFSYVDPDKAAVEDITVHVQAPADWAEPNLWAWSAPDGTNVFSTWPGEALEEGENGWLTKTIPGWVNSIIVNGNEGSVQTSDISIETGKDVWLQVQDAENFTVSYEEPEGTATVEPTEETKTEVTQETAVAEENKETKSSAAPIAGAVVALAAVAGGCGYAVKKKNKNN